MEHLPRGLGRGDQIRQQSDFYPLFLPFSRREKELFFLDGMNNLLNIIYIHSVALRWARYALPNLR